MTADLTLIHEAFLVLVNELDRILDRDDVIGPRAVDVVDHRRQGRRLARTRRSGHEDEAFLESAHLEDRWRELQLLDRANARRNLAEDGAHPAAIEKHVRAESAQALHLVREVGVVTL